MNVKYFLITFSAAVILTASCKKIEFKPEGSVEVEEAIKSEADVAATINAAYAPMTGGNFYGGRLQRISQYLADEANLTPVTGFDKDIADFKSSPNSGSEGIYKEPYVVIQRCNKTLENLALVSNQVTKNNYEGQAKFLRALSHFELVKLFAQPYGYTTSNNHLGIILKTISEFETERARNTVAEAYSLILADLNDAQRLLPLTNGIYPTRFAAKAILARVYFQMNKFDSAYKYANDVITNSSASFDNSATFFAKRFNNPASSESLFHLVNETNAGATARFGDLRNNATPTLSLNLPVAASTYNAATTAIDVRKAMYNNANPVGFGIDKYKSPNLLLTLVHITEMKLVRAESASELGTNLSVAIGDINDITSRAYGGALTNLPAGATAATIKARVRSERKLEMVFENGDRLQEIKRVGAKGEPSFSRGAPWNCDGMILKFPAIEASLYNGFVQNPSGTCI
jgi:starch-binding outer membrane protein, SusD/RagB family